MKPQIKLPFFTMLLLISFASVNAVLFSPALPSITNYFSISEATAEQTISWFLIGYTIGQLLYGPLANRFGRKKAIYFGIGLQIFSCLVCIFAGIIHAFSLLVVGRFLLALGSAVGLKMTFTMVNETYNLKEASQKIAYIMLAFAITPGLSVALGGVLNAHFGWLSCFYACAIYGCLLLVLTMRLPETLPQVDLQALQIPHLVKGYATQFKNIPLMAGGLLMGGCTCFVYVFAAVAPFIAINVFQMSSALYGVANVLPPIGLILGSLTSAALTEKYPLRTIILIGLLIAVGGLTFMFIALFMHLPPIIFMFIPMIIIYFGLCFVLANASSIAMSQTEDKAHGSAVMNFINMGTATAVVLSLGFFSMQPILLPLVYLFILLSMLLLYRGYIYPLIKQN